MWNSKEEIEIDNHSQIRQFSLEYVDDIHEIDDNGQQEPQQEVGNEVFACNSIF